MKKPDMKSYIRQLQHSRGLTQNELRLLLGYSSQTSLTRLMQDCANRASLVQFAQRVRAALQLTREESSLLDDLIELHDIGDDFSTMVAFRRLLRGENIEYAEKLYIHGPHGGAESFLAHFGAMKIRRMLMINCDSVPLYGDLALLKEQFDFPVEHWLYTRGEPFHMVSCLRASMPVLYLPRYSVYTYSFSFDPTTHTRGLMTSDILLCEYETKDGDVQCEVTVFTSPGRGETLKLDITINEALRLLPDRSAMKAVCADIHSKDVMQYGAFCADLERGRTVMRIKQDLGLEQIPVAVLERAIREFAPPQLLTQLAPMSEILVKRQQDVMTKTAPQYHIYRLGAMQRFVETGQLSDHLWCCRPFTIAERLEILNFIRHTLMTRDSFHLRFLKDEDALRCDEIVFYEDRGLSIIKPGTDYAPDKPHEEVLIIQPEFLRFFKRFFLESTMRYRVGSREEAFDAMDALIADCQELLNAEASVNKS